ncbi:sulfite exporter TauE/SafE family protein [Pusillimonas sp.]|uniref:sulfite exporter TauE/SafE family protein n=1 Tax=Pusillimonas sp. TaxID=3040095 RepID=UPI0037CB68AB
MIATRSDDLGQIHIEETLPSPMIDFALVYPALVLSVGYLVLGLTGFGSALIVVPLLANRWPLAEVVAMAILLDIPASMLHGGLNMRQVQWAELRRLLPGMAIGAIAGLWLLGQLDRRWPLFALGCYVVFVGARALLPRSHGAATLSPAWGHPVGALVGLIHVMFATAGPVVVTWLQRRLGSAAAVRATVPVIMVLVGSIAVSVLWTSGQVDADVVMSRWLYGIPIALGGVLLGNRCAARLSPLMMERLLAALLMVSGLSLMQHVFI